MPPSLLMVYAFMFTSVSLSSLFNFTFCFRAIEIYFTTLACHFPAVMLSTSLSFMVIRAFSFTFGFDLFFAPFSSETHKCNSHSFQT